ncbi:hypothetical protein SD77_1571 [Bacillus badius]|uniref:Mobile element protein n=1 Tax=Bacillus badius TaxID=1455 RepID=A0ABR5AT24_BACBA|nr:hypothetical protein SD78_4331 [Bacillus badius]KIL77328.1 hypothetical protein SD77_1571 [Bacillus badius]KZR58041.1 hypothetical protein A3781_01435 [Bacillus badius]
MAAEECFPRGSKDLHESQAISMKEIITVPRKKGVFFSECLRLMLQSQYLELHTAADCLNNH